MTVVDWEGALGRMEGNVLNLDGMMTTQFCECSKAIHLCPSVAKCYCIRIVA